MGRDRDKRRTWKSGAEKRRLRKEKREKEHNELAKIPKLRTFFSNDTEKKQEMYK